MEPKIFRLKFFIDPIFFDKINFNPNFSLLKINFQFIFFNDKLFGPNFFGPHLSIVLILITEIGDNYRLLSYANNVVIVETYESSEL